MHEFRRRVREHAGKICVRDFGKDGDIARILLTENRNGLRQEGREDAEFDEGVHAVESFTLGELGEALNPRVGGHE